MPEKAKPPPNESVTYSSGARDGPPDLRLLHYNDVYHVDASSAEPVGGAARFMTLVTQYREDEKWKGQSDLITLFSGDAFNPSLESSITKGMCVWRLWAAGRSEPYGWETPAANDVADSQITSALLTCPSSLTGPC